MTFATEPRKVRFPAKVLPMARSSHPSRGSGSPAMACSTTRMNGTFDTRFDPTRKRTEVRAQSPALPVPVKIGSRSSAAAAAPEATRASTATKSPPKKTRTDQSIRPQTAAGSARRTSIRAVNPPIAVIARSPPARYAATVPRTTARVSRAWPGSAGAGAPGGGRGSREAAESSLRKRRRSRRWFASRPAAATGSRWSRVVR
jgi:hypothetical protein